MQINATKKRPLNNVSPLHTVIKISLSSIRFRITSPSYNKTINVIKTVEGYFQKRKINEKLVRKNYIGY